MGKCMWVIVMAAGLIGLSLIACSKGTIHLQVTSLQTGGYHTCATLIDSTFKCWGDNASGQLGQGDTVNRGEAQGQMGNSLRNIDVGAQLKVAAFAAGESHTCALLNDKTVKCWGNNASGQLGLGDTTNHGDDPGEMGDNLPAIDLGGGRTAVAVGSGISHTCALLANQRVKCWGDNSYGQSGQGNTADFPTLGGQPGQMGDALPPIDVGVT